MSNLREPAAPAVIAGSFADYRLIKSRSVLQLVIEIPVEGQAAAFDALGYPMPGVEIPVAVARLNPASRHEVGERPLSVTLRPGQQGVIHPDDMDSSVLDGSANTGEQPSCGTAGLTAKARYAAMTAGEQARTRAGRLPDDERFRAWVNQELYGAAMVGAVSNEEAAGYIRARCCNGLSRKLIAEDPEAMGKFIALETAFKIAVGEIAEPR